MTGTTLSTGTLPLSLLAVATADGAPNAGTVLGPSTLMRAGLPAALRARGRRIVHITSVHTTPSLGNAVGTEPLRATNAVSIARTTRVVSDAVRRLIGAGTLPIVLGGDHSISMGSIGGVSRYCRATGRELFVLWIDAHADYNTPDISPSGNMHGMALAMLSGEPGFAPLFAGLSAELKPENTMLVGTRSLDPGEHALLRRRGIAIVANGHIGRFGLRLPMQRFLERVALARGVLHVSFDVDVLDPSIAPGVGTPVPGGLSEGHICQIFELLRISGLVRALDIVELDPTRDDKSRTTHTVVRLVSGLFGAEHMRPTRPDKEARHDRNAA